MSCITYGTVGIAKVQIARVQEEQLGILARGGVYLLLSSLARITYCFP